MSTAVAFERSAAARLLNSMGAICPITRRAVTGIIGAPDVLSRAEPTAAASSSSAADPLLSGAELEDGLRPYGTFARV